MKIILPGGSGLLGRILSRHFHQQGDDVVVLSRKPQQAPCRTVRWDGRTLGSWVKELERADAVINLAGRSVNCRYHRWNRREILDSRLDSTRAIGKAILQSEHPPRLWLQSSTATIYSHRFDAPQDEATGEIGGREPGVPETWRFSIDVATAWERAATEFTLPATRQVLLRSAMVMSADRGGVLDVLLGLVRRGLGGRNGDGRQFVSWIHEQDFIRAIDWLIERHDVTGPVNLCSPNPLPNMEFMQQLREAAGVRYGLPATRWMLEVGAVFLRTETELILKSRRVISGRLLSQGFEFQFPRWRDAARDLLARWKLINSRGPVRVSERAAAF